MKHTLTHFRDIIQDPSGDWISVPGSECEVCGDLWPCDKAGQDATEEEMSVSFIREDWEKIKDTHRAVWAEDGAPIQVCYACGSLWPCDHAGEAA